MREAHQSGACERKNPLGGVLRLLPQPSLPQKISYLVMAATFLTAVMIMTTSFRYLETFLRDRIDQEFPVILRSSARRLSLWYSGRLLEIERVAASPDVVRVLRTASKGVREKDHAGLDGLQASLHPTPIFGAFLLLDAQGREVARSGQGIPITPELCSRLAMARGSAASRIYRFGTIGIHAFSVDVSGPDRTRIGSLHGLLRPGVLSQQLRDDSMSPSGELFLVGADHTYQTVGREKLPGSRFSGFLPIMSKQHKTASYVNAVGQHVVGSALALDFLGWTLVIEEPYEEAFAPVVAVTTPLLLINLGLVVLF